MTECSRCEGELELLYNRRDSDGYYWGVWKCTECGELYEVFTNRENIDDDVPVILSDDEIDNRR
jgi:uncharacterized Zn finger protein